MTQCNFSLSTKAYVETYKHTTADEREAAIAKHYPHYDASKPCMHTEYDSSVTTCKHEVAELTSVVEPKKPTVVKDVKMVIDPIVPKNGTPPKPEKFKRPSTEAGTKSVKVKHPDTRIKTIMTGHEVYKEKDKEAKKYFASAGVSTEVPQGYTEETTNPVVNVTPVNTGTGTLPEVTTSRAGHTKPANGLSSDLEDRGGIVHSS